MLRVSGAKQALVAAATFAGLLVLVRALRDRDQSPGAIEHSRATDHAPLPQAKPLAAPRFGVIIGGALVLALIAAVWSGLQIRKDRQADAISLTGGDPTNAPALLIRYGCASCHKISGVAVPGGLVGPPLDGIRARVYIGGMLRNSPSNLERWIVNPHAFNPNTAMPATGITPAEARDVAAFLYAQ